jgi:hypothetical protein
MSETVTQGLRRAALALAGTSDTARLDAELLMAHALGMTRSAMLLRAGRDPVPATFGALIERRSAHEPVAYIIGAQEFFGLDFAVSPNVLIPRGDSEVLVEAALASAPMRCAYWIWGRDRGRCCSRFCTICPWPPASASNVLPERRPWAGQCAKPWSRSARHHSAGRLDTGRLDKGAWPLRPDPRQPTLCRGRRPAGPFRARP